MLIDLASLRDLMKSNRTVRRFNEKIEVERATLLNLIELTRYCPSGRNAQPLRYAVITDETEREKLFPLLKWAGYFKDWDGPEKGERPTAYLIQYLDTRYGQNCLCDDGLQLEAITLGMHTLGMAGCIIKAFNATEVSRIFNFGDRFVPRYILALGFPAEKVEMEEMSGDEEADFKYYRTSDNVHHVPKRPLEELVLKHK